jgi:hypothetical protein
MHLDELGKRCILLRQRPQRAVQVEELDLFAASPGCHLYASVPRHESLTPAPLGRPTRPVVIDQYLSHDPRHQREKVGTVCDVWLGILKQLDEGFVDERRRP